MDSPFLVFDLIAGNVGLEVTGDTRNLVHQKRDDRKQPVGLIDREESRSRCRRDCFAEFNGPHWLILRRNSAYRKLLR